MAGSKSKSGKSKKASVSKTPDMPMSGKKTGKAKMPNKGKNC